VLIGRLVFNEWVVTSGPLGWTLRLAPPHDTTAKVPVYELHNFSVIWHSCATQLSKFLSMKSRRNGVVISLKVGTVIQALLHRVKVEETFST